MAYKKISAKGFVIKFGTAVTPTAVVQGLDTIGLRVGDRALVEVTAHDSDTTQEYADSGLRDTNEITLSFFYDSSDAVHEAIRAAHAGGAAANSGNNYFLTILLPATGNSASKWAGEGLVTKFDIGSGTVKNGLLVSATFKAVKKETFTT